MSTHEMIDISPEGEIARIVGLHRGTPVIKENKDGKGWVFFGAVDERLSEGLVRKIRGMGIEARTGIPYDLEASLSNPDHHPVVCHERGKVGVYVDSQKIFRFLVDILQP